MGNQEAVQYLTTAGKAEVTCVYVILFPILQEVPLYFNKGNLCATLNHATGPKEDPKSWNISLYVRACVRVLVAELIHITVQPQSQQATVGSRVVLTCRASGPPGLNYQWFRGKEEVSVSQSVSFFHSYFL